VSGEPTTRRTTRTVQCLYQFVCVYHIDVQVEGDFSQRIVVDDLARIVRTVLEQSEQPPDAAVTLVIVDDERIRQLNRTFRGVDHATDVLAFGVGDDSAFVTPEELPPYLGDVVVSYPTAVAQAAAMGHSVEEELALLVVHGCLHLLGYDDATEQERQRMWARQEEILRILR